MDSSIFPLVLIYASVSYGWNYMEQDKWPETCQNALLQSPIDLSNNIISKVSGKPLVLKNWNKTYNATMLNNGHTVHIELSNEDPITITGGKLPGVYKLVQFHFHWGSEHTIDGKRKALESHFVTHHIKYSSLQEAMKYTGGIAVVGVLYQERDHPNPRFDPILNEINKIRKANQKTMIEINPFTLFPKNYDAFYRYRGSLTTPNCNDVVEWIIMHKMLPISRDQVRKFESILNEEGEKLSRNYRDIQPLNGRLVMGVNTENGCSCNN